MSSSSSLNPLELVDNFICQRMGANVRCDSDFHRLPSAGSFRSEAPYVANIAVPDFSVGRYEDSVRGSLIEIAPVAR